MIDVSPEILSLIPFALTLLGAGLVAGVLAGLLGVGGGIVIVPVLFTVFPYMGVDPAHAMHLAVGTSLATIIPTSISSMRAHHRRGAVDWDVLKSWSLSIVVGVVIGTAIAAAVKGVVLTVVFATFATIMAVRLARQKDHSEKAAVLVGGWLRRALGFVIGALSVMVGIGGGTLSVPSLTACGYPVRRAVGTASAIGLVIALPGAIGFVVSGWGLENLPPLSLGYVNGAGFALIVPMTMIAAPWGAHLAHTLPPHWLRRGFAVFLLVTAARMFWSVFG